MAHGKAEPAQDDDLAAAIVVAAKQACAEVARWNADNPLYPTRDDLTGLVLVKLTSVPQLRNIWNDPDPETGGPIGLLRFARTVAKRTAIDEKRRNEARAPEILAARLDEPIYEDGERIGTLADTISDADCTYQAFQFDDLRNELTDQEFMVLHGSVIEGATQQELAKQTGISDSSISRTYIRAKEKAAKWIAWLKHRTDKQIRASICPTFTRRPCLRPNGIAQETVEQWSGLRVVPFHDESSEWRPAIKNQGHIRAKRECWNLACQGIPVGPDNLIFPETRRAEAVRYLPTVTGRDNDFCESCKTAAKRVIPFVAQAERQNPKAKAAAFFGPATFSNIEGRNMDYKQAAAIIKELDIPRTTVARLANMHATEVSAWLGGKLTFSQEKIERISEVVADIEKVVRTLPMKVDLRDPENVRKLIVAVNDAEAQLNLPLTLPVDFDLRTGAAAVADA